MQAFFLLVAFLALLLLLQHCLALPEAATAAAWASIHARVQKLTIARLKRSAGELA
jgi:hypothetical protein